MYGICFGGLGFGVSRCRVKYLWSRHSDKVLQCSTESTVISAVREQSLCLGCKVVKGYELAAASSGGT